MYASQTASWILLENDSLIHFKDMETEEHPLKSQVIQYFKCFHILNVLKQVLFDSS